MLNLTFTPKLPRSGGRCVLAALVLTLMGLVACGGGSGSGGGSAPAAAAPTLSGFAPATGPVGTTLTLTGAHFTGATAVTVNGVSAPFTVNGDTSLAAIVPLGAGTGAVAVTTPGGTATSPTPFTLVNGGGTGGLPTGSGATYYLATTGSDTNDGSTGAPWATFAHAFAVMHGGDNLIVKNGTYTQSLTGMPSGSVGNFTTMKAESDFGVTLDISGLPDTFIYGINVLSKSYVLVQGFRVVARQTAVNNGPIEIEYSDHIILARCAATYGRVTNNAASVSVGDSSYCLVEECYAYGGCRYQFLVYHSDHCIVRRCVARVDYWNDALQCACFTNYDSSQTAWMNNVALDSDTANCAQGNGLYGAWYFENKPDYSVPAYHYDTSNLLDGNVVVNLRPTIYGAGLNDKISGTHTVRNMVILSSPSGFNVLLPPNPQISSTFLASNWTVAGLTGPTYDPGNGVAAGGTGLGVQDPGITASIQNSVFLHNARYGVADYVTSNFNVYFQNAAPTGSHYGVTAPALGAQDQTTLDPTTHGLLYPLRVEAGSALQTAGQGGAPVGADLTYQVGAPGTLYGDPGWNTVTSTPLFPFPHEDVIKADMASYHGPGGLGTRGFCAPANGLNGRPLTLTSYLWEQLGNPCPASIYGH
ncbi:MAG TPA: hypothetical protein VJ623_13195 [Holophagaceae bacterium]|nr:hypothetical protein [Holophagaceae bacterium]